MLDHTVNGIIMVALSVLSIANFLLDHTVNGIIMVALSVLSIANFLSAFVMLQASATNPANRLLRVAALRSIIRSVTVVFAMVVLNQMMTGFSLGVEFSIVVLAGALTAVSMPSVYFMYLYLTTGFLGPDA